MESFILLYGSASLAPTEVIASAIPVAHLVEHRAVMREVVSS